MKTIDSVEDAYNILAQDVLRFIAGRPWESAGAKYGIYPSMVSSEWWKDSKGVRDETGEADATMSESKQKSSAVRFLRDNLLATSGERIWGLTFTLFPDGKFKIEYDYNKPEGYEETDETISMDDAIKGLSDFN